MEEAIVQNAKCLKLVKEPLDAPQRYRKKKMFYELKPILCGGKATEDQHPKIIMV